MTRCSGGARYGAVAALSLSFLLVLALGSCSRNSSSTDLVTFALRGEVVRIDSAAGRIMVAHEEIPNYMPAMVMPFKVKDRNLLVGLAVGDSIGATLSVSRTESWLEGIRVLRRGEPYVPLPADSLQAARQYAEGAPVPDVSLVDELGSPVRLSDFRGTTVVLTFVYTRCPLPDYCILMSDHFAELQGIIRSRGLASACRLVSISFDAAHDRPEVLKQYGVKHGADPAIWKFLTDADTAGRSVAKFADGFGLTFVPAEGLIDHNLRTAVIGPDGVLRKVFRGNEWKPQDIVPLLR
jgi:protein SCO1/2